MIQDALSNIRWIPTADRKWKKQVLAYVIENGKLVEVWVDEN